MKGFLTHEIIISLAHLVCLIKNTINKVIVLINHECLDNDCESQTKIRGKTVLWLPLIFLKVSYDVCLHHLIQYRIPRLRVVCRSSTPRRTVFLELQQQERPRLFQKPVSGKHQLLKGDYFWDYVLGLFVKR